MLDVIKIFLLCLIWVTLIAIGAVLTDIKEERTMRVTEIKHIYQIEHYYGDLSFNKENTNVKP